MGKNTFSDSDEMLIFETSRRYSFTVAAIIIMGADGKRSQLVDDVILPKVRAIDFDDVLVVGDHHAGTGYRHVPVPNLTRTTNDALIKRDVGALSTNADVLWYLSDDHYPAIGNINWLIPDIFWDAIVPMRWTVRDEERIQLNNGEQSSYCGGHGIIIKREVVQRQPWCLGPFDPYWDLLISRRHQAAGIHYRWNIAGIDIYDVEPGARPWE